MNAIDKRIIRCDGVRLASANLPDGGKGTMLVCQPDDILEIIGWIEKPLPPLQKKHDRYVAQSLFCYFCTCFYMSVYTLRIKVW
ncbi:MAG: hypothetical protein K5890_08840 [Bacteroidales bacterium]|nr:hypothetical protein [Bacteroidales bacterium]